MPRAIRRKRSLKQYMAYAVEAPSEDGTTPLVGIVRLQGNDDYNEIAGICIPFVSADRENMDLQMRYATFFGNKKVFVKNSNNQDRLLRAFEGFERLFIRDLEAEARRFRGNPDVYASLRAKISQMERYGKPLEIPFEVLELTGARKMLFERMVSMLTEGVSRELLTDMEAVEGNSIYLLSCPPEFRYLGATTGKVFRKDYSTRSDRIHEYEKRQVMTFHTPMGGAPKHSKATRLQ